MHGRRHLHQLLDLELHAPGLVKMKMETAWADWPGAASPAAPGPATAEPLAAAAAGPARADALPQLGAVPGADLSPPNAWPLPGMCGCPSHAFVLYCRQHEGIFFLDLAEGATFGCISTSFARAVQIILYKRTRDGVFGMTLSRDCCLIWREPAAFLLRAGERRLVPTWRMLPGECRDSLALEVAARCGLPPELIARAAAISKAPPLWLAALLLLPVPSLHPSGRLSRGSFAGSGENSVAVAI